MKVVYICGPYRGPSAWRIEQFIRSAEQAALKVWRLGAVPICPHTMTRYYQGELPDAVWLTGDLELITRCDALLAIEGWQMSDGANAEVKFAKDRDLPVFESIEFFGDWLRKLETQKGERPRDPSPFTGEPDHAAPI